MLKRIIVIGLTFLCSSVTFSQNKEIQIIEETVANRLMLYALNETDIDYDVMISIEGTGFRQSAAKPRLTRVPATSKVNVARLTLLKGKTPNYTYNLVVNDSLSRRALRKKFELVKVKPKKQITVYITENCFRCDSIMKPLENSKYLFTRYNLSEKPEIKEQLQMALPQLDTLITPVFSIGGHLFPEVKNYTELIEELDKE